MRGPLPDQAALYGVLAQLEALGLELLEVRRNRDITADEQTSLTDVLFQHKPGDVVQVTINRNDSEQSLPVTLGSPPPSS